MNPDDYVEPMIVITQEEYRQNEIQEFANLYKAIANRNLKTVLDNKGKNLEKVSGDDY